MPNLLLLSKYIVRDLIRVLYRLLDPNRQTSLLMLNLAWE